jgi:hypothetical protein
VHTTRSAARTQNRRHAHTHTHNTQHTHTQPHAHEYLRRMGVCTRCFHSSWANTLPAGGGSVKRSTRRVISFWPVV